MPRAAGVSVVCEDEGSRSRISAYAMERIMATLTAWKSSGSTPASGPDGGDRNALRK